MTNPDQYRRAPIPADGRTIEAMRLALLDTPEGRAMTNAGDTRLYWMNESDAYMLMSPFGIESPFINTPGAVARLVEAAEFFDRRRKSIEDDVSSGHSGRGPGASSWMREDDRDFFLDLRNAFDALSIALAACKGVRDAS